MATNAERLHATLEQLGHLRSQVVLVGGASTQLFITDAAVAGERRTDDVDFIIDRDATGVHALEVRLRNADFAQRPDVDPICRWRRDDIAIDIMPIDGAVFGFSNRWYRLAWDTAEVRIIGGHQLRVVTPILFIATKLDAFDDRGGGGYQASHDLEDVIAVVDGRVELLEEIVVAPDEIRAYLADRIGRLLADARFVDAVAGHLAGDDASQDRLPIVVDRLRRLIANAR